MARQRTTPERRAELKRRWNRSNPEKRAESSRRSYLRAKVDRPARHLLNKARWRAKRDEREFRITEADILAVWPQDNRCPILGCELQCGQGRDFAPSLDRIDNAQGYVPGNLAVLSWKANAMKRELTVDHIRALARLVDLASSSPQTERPK